MDLQCYECLDCDEFVCLCDFENSQYINVEPENQICVVCEEEFCFCNLTILPLLEYEKQEIGSIDFYFNISI